MDGLADVDLQQQQQQQRWILNTLLPHLASARDLSVIPRLTARMMGVLLASYGIYRCMQYDVSWGYYVPWVIGLRLLM